ncbi:hypothetical protein [Burkholderia aenigmatica]|uniref:hypothetical protein n=1 Tax=Burkholderia aenigmatica TaxID=2015348 RepID=UPI00264D2F73|nr:hypothetical protein [Burkholderia aenigmatica]MDN7880128.1 hypothetical protein [Burkholderia aenigmatica]
MSLLTDAVLALALTSVTLVQADMAAVRATQVSIASQTGQYMYGLQQGVNKYIATNADVLSGRSAGSLTNPQGVAITVANPQAPTMLELQSGGFLPTGYTLNNPSKLTFTIAITPANCPGVGCQLPATISSSQYTDSQGNVRNDLLTYAVAAAGLDGGQSLVGSPSLYTGPGRAWSMPNTTNKPGSLMMRAGVLTTGYVDTLPFYKTDGSRALTGAMNASGYDINNVGTMASNSIKNAGDIATNSVTASGRIATSGYNPADLPNGWSGGVRTWDVYAGGSIGVGPSGGAAPVAYLSSNGTVMGQNVVGQNSVTGAWLHSTGSAQIDGDMYTAGNQTINGSLTARNVINLPALAWAGWGCSGYQVTSDPNGQLLSCQSGVWRNAGSTFSVASYAVPVNTSGQYLGVHAYCAIGQLRGGPQGGFQEVYSDGNNNWWANNKYWPDGQWADPQIVVNCLNLTGAGI